MTYMHGLDMCMRRPQKALGNSYTTVCPPVGGDKPRALASGVSLVQAHKPLYNYFIPLSSM